MNVDDAPMRDEIPATTNISFARQLCVRVDSYLLNPNDKKIKNAV